MSLFQGHFFVHVYDQQHQKQVILLSQFKCLIQSIFRFIIVNFGLPKRCLHRKTLVSYFSIFFDLFKIILCIFIPIYLFSPIRQSSVEKCMTLRVKVKRREMTFGCLD